MKTLNCLVFLMFGSLFLTGCPGGDDDDDDTNALEGTQITVTVEGAELVIGNLVSAFYFDKDEEDGYLFAFDRDDIDCDDAYQSFSSGDFANGTLSVLGQQGASIAFVYLEAALPAEDQPREGDGSFYYYGNWDTDSQMAEDVLWTEGGPTVTMSDVDDTEVSGTLDYTSSSFRMYHLNGGDVNEDGSVSASGAFVASRCGYQY